MSNKKLVSKTLATTAALAFAAVTATSVMANTTEVKCVGGNSCKHMSACGTEKAKNACAGHGVSMEKDEAACTKAKEHAAKLASEKAAH